MTTHNSAFKAVILETLRHATILPLPIDNFYQAAEATIKFDQDDLAPTTLKGEKTREPSWKRNLRNSLQDLKTKGQIVNFTNAHWRQATPNIDLHLDLDTSWSEILQAAQKAKEDEESWTSPIEQNNYHVESVSSNEIIIMRHSSSTKVTLSRNDVRRALISINAAGGIVGRKTLLKVVAKESALVYFHPNLSWDNQSEFISVGLAERESTRQTYIAVIKSIAEAKNDDPVYQSYARKIRKGQSALRRNLLLVYNNRCCITQTGPHNVLQAAHIEPHSKKGDNDSTNALLLRSDIHDLLDDGLILIEPTTMKVVVHPDLENTVYSELNGNLLMSRVDGKTPSKQKLKEKWNAHTWLTRL